MAVKDINIKNISNIQVSKECHKKLKIMSVEQETTLQEIVTSILERVTGKKKGEITQE